MRLFNQLSAFRQMFAYRCVFYVRCKHVAMLGGSHSCGKPEIC